MSRRQVFMLMGSMPIILVVILGLASAPQCREHWYMTRVYWRKSQPVHFYGQVLDQSGKPIGGATVSIMIEDFNWGALLGARKYMTVRRFARMTDADGRFSVTGTTAMQLGIEKVAHPEYLAIPEITWDVLVGVDGFRYSRSGRAPYYVPDSQKPAIFPLRKEGEERVLWPSRGGRDERNPW